MRQMLLAAGIVLLVFGEPLVADEKSDVPAALKGTWKVTFGAKPGSFVTNAQGAGTVTIGNGTVEWTEVEGLIKAGKGTIKVNATAKPATIELKSGETVYKGIYRFKAKGKGKESTETDPNALDLLLSPPGEEAPKAFGIGPSLPTGFKGVLLGLAKLD